MNNAYICQTDHSRGLVLSGHKPYVDCGISFIDYWITSGNIVFYKNSNLGLNLRFENPFFKCPPQKNPPQPTKQKTNK